MAGAREPGREHGARRPAADDRDLDHAPPAPVIPRRPIGSGGPSSVRALCRRQDRRDRVALAERAAKPADRASGPPARSIAAISSAVYDRRTESGASCRV